MIRHIVSWKFKEDIAEADKAATAKKIKDSLESLKDAVPGIISIEVITNNLPGCSGDIVLNSLYENEESLNAYQVCPGHIEAGAYIRTVLCDRCCVDIEEKP